MQGENPPRSADGAGKPGLTDPERWVEDHGDFLFRFALMRLRDPIAAEDAVQETFLAALKGGGRFAGRSAERSWLAGILKNKICDRFRKMAREVSFADMEFYAEDEEQSFVADNLGKGAWKGDATPSEWNNPGQSLDNELFWKTYRHCADKLPKKVATAFHLREVDGIESKEVCATLGISENNLWVMLHRARMALRRCLETNWFAKKM